MSVNEQLAPPPKPRLSPLEFRNTDLVSRLLAATPPYLYNMSLLPNTYFFSEMLRSFVQAKTDPGPRPFQPRRARKRPWKAEPPKMEPPDWAIKAPETMETENMNFGLAERKSEQPMEAMYPSMGEGSSGSGLVLPPPPPMWYPPLYPGTAPYGIDPLHFFIDLRVSGHIYDRNKNQKDEAAGKVEEERKQQGLFKQGHVSAFSVPVPKMRQGPMNLSLDERESKNVKFDVKSLGLEKSCNKTGTSYVMGNIGSIYRGVAEEAGKEEEDDEEKKKKVKDLRALIGLELVVDYMNHAKPQPRRPLEDGVLSDSEGGSPTLEVVALQDDS